jgi:hypothetical protein
MVSYCLEQKSFLKAENYTHSTGLGSLAQVTRPGAVSHTEKQPQYCWVNSSQLLKTHKVSRNLYQAPRRQVIKDFATSTFILFRTGS